MRLPDLRQTNMMTIRQLSSVTLILLFLAACGQKGPLYLPGDPNDVRSEVPATDSESVDDEDDSDPQP